MATREEEYETIIIKFHIKRKDPQLKVWHYCEIKSEAFSAFLVFISQTANDDDNEEILMSAIKCEIKFV